MVLLGAVLVRGTVIYPAFWIDNSGLVRGLPFSLTGVGVKGDFLFKAW